MHRLVSIAKSAKTLFAAFLLRMQDIYVFPAIVLYSKMVGATGFIFCSLQPNVLIYNSVSILVIQYIPSVEKTLLRKASDRLFRFTHAD